MYVCMYVDTGCLDFGHWCLEIIILGAKDNWPGPKCAHLAENKSAHLLFLYAILWPHENAGFS